MTRLLLFLGVLVVLTLCVYGGFRLVLAIRHFATGG